MPTLLPPPTVVPRDPVITAEARLKVRLWRAPRRESIPFCRGDWSIARTPSTSFIPHPPPPHHSRPRHGNPSPGRTARAVPAEGPTSLCVIPRPREGSRTCPLSCLLQPSCPSHYCGGRLKVRRGVNPSLFVGAIGQSPAHPAHYSSPIHTLPPLSFPTPIGNPSPGRAARAEPVEV